MDVYLNFRNEARQAIAFYEEVFNVKCTDLTTYAEIPDADELPLYDEVKTLVINASLEIYDTTVMFSDVPEGMGDPVKVGNNVTLVIQTKTVAEATALFEKLAAQGNVLMPLEKTFWAELYGACVDQFGIGWQINLTKTEGS